MVNVFRLKEGWEQEVFPVAVSKMNETADCFGGPGSRPPDQGQPL